MGSLAGEPSWQLLATTKKQAVLDLIPLEWRLPLIPSSKQQKNVTSTYVEQFLSNDEINITNSSAVRIVEMTTSGKWSAVDVVKAFCHRAALAHQLTNCLHEIFFDQAIADAKALDDAFAAGTGPAGPLHGLPISFKDQFHVRGVETTMGYVGWTDTFEGVKGTGKEKIYESELVREVRALGAIPFCKTSLPHSVMSMETWNNIVGYTLNPHNRHMTSGGSSGGEGALVGMRGSPLGFGTDIGGSIRIPAAFCGLFGIRPSFGRLPYLGAANSMPGQNSIPSVCGPLTTSASSLKLILKSTLGNQPWLYDPAVVEMPWREELSKIPSKLTFGIYRADEQVRPLAPVKRALDELVSILQQRGHEIVEWNPPTHAKAMEIGLEAFTSDGGADIHHHIGLSGEHLMDRVAEIYGREAVPPMTGDKIHATNLKMREFQKEYMDYWNSTIKSTTTGRPVDAVICPVAPFAALQLEKTTSIVYTPWVNVLDYTAVVVPITKVDAGIDNPENNYQPITDLDKVIHDEYDVELVEGTPVGLQLVGRRFQEEKMIAIAELVEMALADGKPS